MDEIDEELFEVDNSCGQNDSETSSTLLENVNVIQFTNFDKGTSKSKSKQKEAGRRRVQIN